MTKRFIHAFRGIYVVFSTQQNFRIHVFAFSMVILLGIYFKITATEWCTLLLASTLVLAAEMVNTSLEFLSDFVTKERREEIRKVKDTAAGTVLVSALIALAIGLVVFLPKIMGWKF